MSPDHNDTGAATLSPSYQYVDPLALPRCTQAGLTSPATPLSVYVEAPEAEQRRLRYAPEFVDDPDGTGMFRGLREGAYHFPPNFIVTAPDAYLLGYRMVAANDYFFPDISLGEKSEAFIERIGSLNPFPNENTFLRRIENSGQFTLDQNGRQIREIRGTVISLASTEPSNYGSLLFRVLPKIATLKHYGLMDLPVLVYANHASYIDLLVAAGIKRENIINHYPHIITKVERLLVPSLRNPDAFLDEQSVAFFGELMRSFAPAAPERRKLYISRLSHGKNGGTSRVMQNEEELIEKLSALGIEIFEPEKHSATEQIATFASAELVIGPSGAGMFNVVFCQPGTKIIDIESEPHWIFAHAGLFASKNLRYGIFNGKVSESDPRPVHRNWNVNIPALIDRVQNFL